MFVSGNLALDLAGTQKWRRTEPEELINDVDDLAQWFAETDQFPDDLHIDAATFRRAMSLREAIYRLASSRLQNTPFDPADLEVVNNLAALPGVRVELTDAGVMRSGDARAALADIARSAVDALADTQTPMKECGRPACTRIYIDRSRGARRTWCGMDECGNRVKAAAYRARKRS
ncbi:CGNR zinc finger domain-containing protein [Mycobacterium sp. NPDC003323]